MTNQQTIDEESIQELNERPYVPFALPCTLRFDLIRTAERLRLPVSDLLEAFVKARWHSFITEKLPVVWQWRSCESLSPEWLSVWQKLYGAERSQVVMLALSGGIRQRVEPVLREEERRFFVCSLSETLRLFFAAEWETFRETVTAYPGLLQTEAA